MFATFMEVLDTTVVNVSLPHIAGSLSATIDEATWALTSYLVANAIILPMTGWLASVFGRKRLLMLSVVGFTVASFLCGLAPTLPLLDLLPHHAGRDRRRAAAALAGGAARSLPAAGARQGHGLLGTRHRRRADSRPRARRLADRQLQLALGVLHQPAGRHRVARDDEAVHLRSAVSASRKRGRSTTGASACSRSASARCRSCSTRARRTTGSRRASSRRWPSSRPSTLVALVIHELRTDGSGRRPARLQGAHATPSACS